MYKVVRDFYDLQTNHDYKVGDKYPCVGLIPNKARIDELITMGNKYGEAFIVDASPVKTETKAETKQEDK